MTDFVVSKLWAMLLTGCLLPIAVQAAENAIPAPEQTADQSSLQEVTVTARRVAEKASDVPIPLSVLSGDQLDQSGTSQIQQLQFEAPSIGVAVPNARQTNIEIRGLGNNPAADGLATSVGIYIDGVYLDRQAMADFDLIDIDRIEILRGPQGTVFGKNTTAGALSITTAAPEFQFGGSAELDVGNYDTLDARATVTGPIDDRLAFRVSAYDANHSGYLSNVYAGGSDLSLHREGVRGQLLFKDGDEFSLRLIGEYSNEADSQGDLVLYSPGPSRSLNPRFIPFQLWTERLGIHPVDDPDGLVTDINGFQHLSQSQAALTADSEWNIDGVTLSSITAWRNWQFVPHNDFDWTYASVFRTNGAAADDNQFSEELRVASPTGQTLSYVAGLYYFRRRLDSTSITGYGPQYAEGLGPAGNPALDNGTSETTADPTTDSYAAFSQGVWTLDPQWSLTGGIRETYEQNSEDVYRGPFFGGTGTPPPSVAPYSGGLAIADWGLSALASVSYKLDPETLFYASLSRGAKAGGFNSPQVPQTLTGVIRPIDSLRVQPERADDGEIGIKTAFLDHHLVFDADAFWTLVKGYQANTLLTDGEGNFQSVITNVGFVRARGLEFDATALPAEGLKFTASGSYNDTTYQSFRNAPIVQGALGTSQDLTGRPVVGAPRWTGSVSGTYTHTVTDTADAYFTAEYAAKSGFYGYIDDSPYSWIKPYGVTNFRLGAMFGDGRYEAVLWVRNAFDTRYFTVITPSISGSGGYYATVADPQTFGATFRVKF